MMLGYVGAFYDDYSGRNEWANVMTLWLVLLFNCSFHFGSWNVDYCL